MEYMNKPSEIQYLEAIKKTCLIFVFHNHNSNATSALLASLDIDPILKNLPIYLPKLLDPAEELKNKVEKYDRIILAVSLYSIQFQMYKECIQRYKLLFSSKVMWVIAGGPHAMGNPFSLLINGVDIVCLGEGELVIREIIHEFIGSGDYSNIHGIAYKSANGKIKKNPKPKLIVLDDFPPFSIKHNLIRPIEITRGCAWKCRFCQVRSRGIPVRHRSPDEIVKYVQYTKKYFSKRRTDIRFISPNAFSYGSNDGKNLNLQIVKELLSKIRQVIGPSGRIYFGSFPSEVRPETITEESVAILKKFSNAAHVIIGGQSGSDRILELSDRGHNSFETYRAVKLLRNAGIEVYVDLIFGLPGEEEKDVDLTITHMHNLVGLGAKIHTHTFLPLVGTPFSSKPPGVINSKYKKILPIFQNKTNVKGQHLVQEQQAKVLAEQKSLYEKLKTELEKSYL